MRGVRFGMLRAEAVQQREQMRAVPPAVPLGGLRRLLDGEVDRLTGRGERGKRARVQLVCQRVTQRMIVERHGPGS